VRVFLTGATGVIGRHAVPALLADGHVVVGAVRSDDAAAALAALGGEPLQVDLFEAPAVSAAVVGADALIHFATAIPPLAAMRDLSAWALNDRLRTEAARTLVDAALAAGVPTFVQQALTFVYADGGDAWLDEDAPVDPPWVVTESALVAEAEVERFAAAGGRGIVLRLGRLYGPGDASAELVGATAVRKLPVIGRGTNYVSSLHAADAGAAVAAALHAPAGTYNVVDDHPVTAKEHTTSLAAAIGAPRPRHVPRWLARGLGGDMVRMLIRSQRVSNRRFAEATGWSPSFPDVRAGWADLAHGAGV
jgi:nucleoside-diphosphate-sugar epimerase